MTATENNFEAKIILGQQFPKLGPFMSLVKAPDAQVTHLNSKRTILYDSTAHSQRTRYELVGNLRGTIVFKEAIN
jgi:hypothetical protein